MTRKLTIVCDADAVICDFFGRLFDLYHEQTGERVKMEQILTWNMNDHVQHPKVLEGIFHQPGFFASLTPVAGALESLRRLREAGHELVVATTPCNDHSAAEKLDWFRRNVPQDILHHKDVFVGHAKHRIHGDVLIDDGAHNADAFAARWPDALIVGPAFHYNQHGQYHARTGQEVAPHLMGTDHFYLQAWEEIVRKIEEHANRP